MIQWTINIRARQNFITYCNLNGFSASLNAMIITMRCADCDAANRLLLRNTPTLFKRLCRAEGESYNKSHLKRVIKYTPT